MKTEHTTMTAENTKIKDEMSEMEKKLARSNILLLTAKFWKGLIEMENQKRLAKAISLLLAAKKKLLAMIENERVLKEECDLKVASIKSMYDNRIQTLEEDLDESKKQNTELQSKIQQLQKQMEELQKAGPATSIHPSGTSSSVSSDRRSSSPSEAPKTTNIRPIASSPAAIKPQTVPVQPQSAALRVTASIRPMAIAPTAIVPISTSTPTATVMPTTVTSQESVCLYVCIRPMAIAPIATSQESQQDGDSITPVQQLFPQPSGSSTGTRPTQQVQRFIHTQETTSQSVQEIITETCTVQQTNKRQRDDQDSSSTRDDTVQKRQKTTVAEPVGTKMCVVDKQEPSRAADSCPIDAKLTDNSKTVKKSHETKNSETKICDTSSKENSGHNSGKGSRERRVNDKQKSFDRSSEPMEISIEDLKSPDKPCQKTPEINIPPPRDTYFESLGLVPTHKVDQIKTLQKTKDDDCQIKFSQQTRDIPLSSPLGQRFKKHWQGDSKIPIISEIETFCYTSNEQYYSQASLEEKRKGRYTEKLRNCRSPAVTFKLTKEYINQWFHKYKFNKQDKLKFERSFATGLEKRSCILLSKMEKCKVVLERLSKKGH